MITLAAGNTLKGKAATGTAVTYTINGDSVASGADTFQVLGQGQLASSTGDLLSTTPVPSSTVYLIKNILLTNTTASPVTGIILYVNGSAAANQVVQISLVANGSAIYNNGEWKTYDSGGSTLGGAGIVTSVTATDSSITVGGTATNPTISRAALTGDVTASAGSNATTLAAGSASNLNSGTLLAARMPALTGDITTSAGAVATTLATVNTVTPGTFGSATATPVITVNGKGLTTASAQTTITPAVGSITGLGTGVGTFLATPTSANLASALTDETGSGANVFANAAVTKPKDVEATVYVDSANTQGWSGSDFGAWFNDAWAYLKTTYGAAYGGTIKIGPGTISYSTPIVAATAGASLIVSGSGNGNAGTQLLYTPTTATIAMTFAGGSGNDGGIILENFNLTGMGGGLAGGTTGIQFGTVSVGMSQPSMKDVSVLQFNTGIKEFAGTAFGLQMSNVVIQLCTTAFLPQGENNKIFGGLISGNATAIALTSTGLELQAFGTAFDDNTTTAINQTQTSVRTTLNGCRFENVAGGTSTYITMTNGTIIIVGGGMQDDVGSGTSTGFIQQSGGITNVYSMWTASSGRTITQVNNITGGYTNMNLVIGPGSTNILASFTSGYANADTPINSNLISNYGTASQSITTVAGTAAYLTASPLKIPVEWTPGTGIRVGTAYTWRFVMHKTAVGTGLYSLKIHQGTAGTTADTAIFTQTWTQTAAIDYATMEVQLVYTTVGASGLGYVVINPINHSAATAAGFGFVVATDYTGTSTASTTLTAGLITGLSITSATGTPVVTIPFMNGQVDNVG